MVTSIGYHKFNDVPSCYEQNCGGKKSFKANYNIQSYYPKTHSGVITGGILGGINLLISILTNIKAKSNFAKNIPRMLLSIGMYTGCGAIVDYLRNNRAPNKHYDKSNTGAKVGGWLGVGVGLISGIVGTVAAKKGIKNMNIKIPSEVTTLSGLIVTPFMVGLSALGGWLMGKISDHFAYKN